MLTWCVKIYSDDLSIADQDEALEWALQVPELTTFWVALVLLWINYFRLLAVSFLVGKLGYSSLLDHLAANMAAKYLTLILIWVHRVSLSSVLIN